MYKFITKTLVFFTFLIVSIFNEAFAQLSSPSNEDITIENRVLVADGAKLFSPESLRESSKLIKEISSKYNLSLYVLTSDTSHGLTSEDYKKRVIESWKLEDKSLIILIVIMEENLILAHISDDLQTKLSKSTLESIISETMLKNFKEGNFDIGIINTLVYLKQYLDGASLAKIIAKRKYDEMNLKEKTTSLILIVSVAFVLFYMSKRRTGKKSALTARKYQPYRHRR